MSSECENESDKHPNGNENIPQQHLFDRGTFVEQLLDTNRLTGPTYLHFKTRHGFKQKTGFYEKAEFDTVFQCEACMHFYLNFFVRRGCLNADFFSFFFFFFFFANLHYQTHIGIFFACYECTAVEFRMRKRSQ